jgi:radical SAM superfamily enzyme YgiQ (UPF0313 family)
MTDILLINPPCDSWLSKVTEVQPIGLCLIASALIKEGYEVKILDSIIEEKDEEKTVEDIKKINPRFVGLYTTSGQIKTCLSIAKKLKPLNIKTIFGGPFISFLPEIFNMYDCFDYAFIGEGEISFPKFFKEISNCKDNKRRIEYGGFVEDLNKSPLPAFDLLPMKKYYSPFKHGNFCITLSSRGCPYNCIYCSHHSKVRVRSTDNMIEELKILNDKYKVKWIQFSDDIFTINRERTLELCKKIIKEEFNFYWQCQTRIEHIDKELLKLMYKAGCRTIGFGIESANESTRKLLGKGNINNETIEKNRKLCKEANIEFFMNLMIGLPDETLEDMKKSVEFAIKIDADYMLPHCTVAYPYTKLFEMGLQKGILYPKIWYDYVKDKAPLPNFVEKYLTIKEIKKAQGEAFKQFFLRPKYIIKRLRKIETFGDISQNFHSAISLPFKQ